MQQTRMRTYAEDEDNEDQGGEEKDRGCDGRNPNRFLAAMVRIGHHSMHAMHTMSGIKTAAEDVFNERHCSDQDCVCEQEDEERRGKEERRTKDNEGAVVVR